MLLTIISTVFIHYNLVHLDYRYYRNGDIIGTIGLIKEAPMYVIFNTILFI